MRIFIIGEICADQFVIGSVERICPEGPVPVLKKSMETFNDGMAGNVVKNFESLRPDYEIHTCLGFCGTKTRYVDERSKYILLRVDEEKFVEPLDILCIKRVFQENVYDAVVISDYNKGYLSKDVLKQISKICNVPLFIDTKKVLGNWSIDFDFVKINDHEYRNNILMIGDMGEPRDFCQNLIVTQGNKGSIAYLFTEEVLTAKSYSNGIHDVSGAGDSFLVGFVVKYLETANIQQAMDYANKVAAVAVSKPGVATVSQKEVDILEKTLTVE